MQNASQEKNSHFLKGDVRSLFNISLPLMISSLATLSMIFVDRLFLANYSLNTLNAAVNSGTLAWAFFGGMGMLTAMSEVFVAQYNGAKQESKIGSCVWQMIWIALFSFFFFIPMALWVGPAFYANSVYADLQVGYFSILMLFAPGYALTTALSGFFIGRGKTRLLIVLAISANLVNIALDRLLIFGVEGLVPEMGIHGAAIATCSGYLLQAGVLFVLFLRPKNRKQFGTNNWAINKPLLTRGFRVGVPQGIFYSLEIIGWAVFFEMMTTVSEVHITISSICQSIIILLSFFLDGLSKGVAAVAGNFIGAKRYDMTKKVFKSGLKLQIIFSLSTFILFVLDPTITIPFFLNGQQSDLFLSPEFLKTLQVSLFFVFLYITFEGIRWVISGLLIAAGDTLFLLIAATISVWLFLLMPIYLIVVKFSRPIEVAWALAFIYSVVTCLIYYLRFHSGKWKELELIRPEQKPLEAPELLDDDGERLS